METTILSGAELGQHLGQLPQELYDKIFELVFTAEPGTIQIDKYYKPPAQLQVSRATRKQFAKSYYDGEGVKFTAKSKPAAYMVPQPSGYIRLDLSAKSLELLQELSSRLQKRPGAETWLTLEMKCESFRLEKLIAAVVAKIVQAKLHTIRLVGSIEPECVMDEYHFPLLLFEPKAEPKGGRKWRPRYGSRPL